MKVKRESEVVQSCPTLHDPMDCSLPGSSIHGIFQARVLEWSAEGQERKSSKVKGQRRGWGQKGGKQKATSAIASPCKQGRQSFSVKVISETKPKSMKEQSMKV